MMNIIPAVFDASTRTDTRRPERPIGRLVGPTVAPPLGTLVQVQPTPFDHARIHKVAARHFGSGCIEIIDDTGKRITVAPNGYFPLPGEIDPRPRLPTPTRGRQTVLSDGSHIPSDSVGKAALVIIALAATIAVAAAVL